LKREANREKRRGEERAKKRGFAPEGRVGFCSLDGEEGLSAPHFHEKR